MRNKPITWVQTSLEDLRSFPANARRLAGYELRRVQSGLMPDDWKPMKSIGPGVFEIRIRTGRAHRIFYVAKYEEAIYVLHAFEKKTKRTRQADLELGRKRLTEVVQSRSKQ